MPSLRRLLTWSLIGLANLALVGVIAALLAATWLPAYFERHPEKFPKGFGESKMAGLKYE